MAPSVMMVGRGLLSLVGINYELLMPWHRKRGGPHGGFFVKVVVKVEWRLIALGKICLTLLGTFTAKKLVKS